MLQLKSQIFRFRQLTVRFSGPSVAWPGPRTFAKNHGRKEGKCWNFIFTPTFLHLKRVERVEIKKWKDGHEKKWS